MNKVIVLALAFLSVSAASCSSKDAGSASECVESDIIICPCSDGSGEISRCVGGVFQPCTCSSSESDSSDGDDASEDPSDEPEDSGDDRVCSEEKPVRCSAPEAVGTNLSFCCALETPYCSMEIVQCLQGKPIKEGVVDKDLCPEGVHCENDGGYCCDPLYKFCTEGRGCSFGDSAVKGENEYPELESGTGGSGSEGTGGTSGSVSETGTGGGAAVDGVPEGCDEAAFQVTMDACMASADYNDQRTVMCASACSDKEYYRCEPTTGACNTWTASCDALSALERMDGSIGCGSCPANCN